LNHSSEMHQEPRYHRLSLFDFIDTEIINEVLGHVVDVGQIPVFVQEPMDRETFFCAKSPPKPDFCIAMEADPEHKKLCRKFFNESVHKSATYGRPLVSTCPYGLSFAFGPLILKRGVCTAALVAGYSRTQDASFCKEAVGDGVDDLERLECLYDKLPEVSSNKMLALADFLVAIASFLMKLIPLREGNYEDFLHSDMAVARNLIHEFLLDENAPGQVAAKIELEGNEEARLIKAVARGQRNVAEVRLRDILDKLLVVYEDDAMALKGHIMELAVLLSRAPLFQVTSSDGEPFSLNQLPAVNPPSGKNFLVLKHWVLTVLHQSVDMIERKQNSDIKAQVVREVITYINANLDKTLRLDHLANAVSFSGQHLSRLFLEEMGMTVSTYVTLVRIEEAKRLLRSSSLTVSQIADRLNYYDSTYFAKVFKKHTGLSPISYKKNS